VGVGAGVVALDDTPKTVPVTCARVGLLFELRVTERHGVKPVVATGVGVTACQAPEPLCPAGLNHSRPLPPPRLQTLSVTEVKALPAESEASKYFPDEVNEGALTGSDPYWATVSPPTPIALTVVPAFVAVAVPLELDEVPLAEPVEPVGAAGATGATGAGGGALPTLAATLLSAELADVKPADVAVTA
jgi:hypothetical protein